MMWTEQRRVELEQLRQLLIECITINRGSHVIERLQRIEKLASELWESDLSNGRESFHTFLVGLVISESQRQAKQ